MIKLRRSLFWTLFGIILILILYLSLPQIVAALLKSQLASAGLRDPVVDIEALGLQGATVSKLGFYYSGSQHGIDLQSRDIRLSYSISGLLSGRLDQIVVSTTDLAVQPQQVSAAPASTEKQSISLPSIADLPFRVISLERAKLIYRQTDKQDVSVDISGNVDVDAKRLKAQMKISRLGHDKLQANLFVLDSGDMRLLVHDPLHDQSLIDLSSSRLKLVDKQLNTTLAASLDLEKISGLLEAWGIEPAITGLTGKVIAQGQVSFPVMGTYTLTEWLQASNMQADMDIKLSAQEWAGLAQEVDVNVPLHVDVNAGLLTWDFAANSSVSLIPLITHSPGEDSLLAKLLDKQRTQKLHVNTPDGFKLEMTVGEDLGERQINKEQAIHLQYGDSNSVLKLNARIDSPRFSLHPSLRLQSRMLFALDSSDAAIVYAGSVNAQGEAGITYSNEGLELILQPQTGLSANNFIYDSVSIKSLKLKLLSLAKCGYQNKVGEWYCGAFAAHIVAPELGFDQYLVKTKAVNANIESCSVKGSEWQLKAHADLRDIALTSAKQTIKLEQVKADLAFSNTAIDAQAKLYAAHGALQAGINMNHNPVSKEGKMDFRLLPVTFNAATSFTDPLFDRQSFPLQFDDGVLKIAGGLKWRPANKKQSSTQSAFKIEQNTNIQIAEVAGRYQKIMFRGLNATLQVQGWDRFTLQQPAEFRVAELNPGIPVSAIRLAANMDYSTTGKQAFTINGFSARTLGGEIASEHIYVDLARKHNPFTVALRQLDITKILQLEASQGIYGTGYINGELPFDLTSTGLFIKNGKISVQPPGGKLQYKANERVKNLAKANANMAMLLQALTDFNYTELDADADYDPDGKLVMKVRLKGANPEFQQGRPVHLNVNVEENVLQLIRSIQLGDRISEKIGERVLERKQKE